MAAGLAWAASACGGSAAAPHAAAGPSAAPATSALAVSPARLARLRELVSQAQSVPPFVPPGPPVNAALAKGDRVVVFPSSSEISYCADEANDLVALGKTLGISVTNFTTTGQPTQWVQGALQAIATHANAFAMTCGIPPSALTPQLNLAQQDHVATILDQLYDPSLPVPKDVTAATGIPLYQAERLIVDDAIVQNGGRPFHALILTADDLISGPGAAKAAEQELKAQCGQACPYTVLNVPVADWTTRMQSDVSAALTADPKITAIIALFDGMVPDTVPAAEAAHRPGLHIYTYGAGAGVVKLIETTHGLVAANIGASSEWAAYVLMDELLRVLTHSAPAPATRDYPPLRMWTPSNVSQYFAPNGGYGTQYITGFDRLWGVHP
ncbi:MAG: hypothetical protein K6U14_06965 [Firmicutes bacterium]|nr:sugar ABC transporter substrate-binding protein [Alicyclobacillaceae bacterium]MCL6497360.1 hypothetical protein [Bacillota bacterium]